MSYKEEWEDCCGHCTFHKNHTGERVCYNERSEYYGIDTEYSDLCDSFEARSEAAYNRNRMADGYETRWQ